MYNQIKKLKENICFPKQNRRNKRKIRKQKIFRKERLQYDCVWKRIWVKYGFGYNVKTFWVGWSRKNVEAFYYIFIEITISFAYENSIKNIEKNIFKTRNRLMRWKLRTDSRRSILSVRIRSYIRYRYYPPNCSISDHSTPFWIPVVWNIRDLSDPHRPESRDRTVDHRRCNVGPKKWNKEKGWSNIKVKIRPTNIGRLKRPPVGIAWFGFKKAETGTDSTVGRRRQHPSLDTIRRTSRVRVATWECVT